MKTTKHKARCIVDSACDISSLGLAVRVSYIAPSDTKGGRWRALIDEGHRKVSAIVPNDHSGAREDGKLDAVEKALGKWALTFDSIPPERITVHARAFDGKHYYYFFNCQI